MKAIKVLILSLMLTFGGGGMWVTAHNSGFVPKVQQRIQVNTCGGAVIGYSEGVTLGVTAKHCIHAPNNTIDAEGGTRNGKPLRYEGDLAYFDYFVPEAPKAIHEWATKLPNPGDRIWMLTVNYFTQEFLPVPGTWLGVRDHWQGAYNIYTVWGGAMRGFSGSPVVDDQGKLIGVVSIGHFIDISDSQIAPYAPWTGVSVPRRLLPRQ